MSLAGISVSLTEVARRAQVSIATASRVLNGKSATAVATRERVLEVAKELGYIPDPRFRLMGRSRGRGGGRTKTIGLLASIKTLTAAQFEFNPYYARLFLSIERAAREKQNHTLVSMVTQGADDYLPDFVADGKVDGVIIASYCADDVIDRVHKQVPVVVVNYPAPERLNVSSLMPDEAVGIRLAMEYLYEIGHRRIYYFGINDSVPPSRHHAERAQAFEEYVAHRGLAQSKPVILGGRSKSLNETCADQLRAWAATGEMPTALVCAFDGFAFAFLEAAEQLGISVPGRLSVIGADDLMLAAHTRPKLTSIRQPFEVMGAEAVRILLDEIEGRDGMPSRTVQRLGVSLVKRDSCGPVPV